MSAVILRGRALACAAMTAAALALGACGGSSNHPKLLSTDWQDDQGKSIAAVQARLRGAHPVPADLVVAVAGARADKIIGAPLSGAPAWSFSHALDARPIIAGGVVVASGGGEVVALDARTGKQLWARPTGGLALLGAGDDGALTALTLRGGASSTLLVIGRDGGVKHQIETDEHIGDPAVLGGVVFVPWANQYVSAIDGSTGDELGRVTLRDNVTRAIPIGGALYFGESAFVRFDDHIKGASRGGATRVGLPSRELPGKPRLLVPGTEKQAPVANARDRDRLFARPSAPTGPLAVDSNRFYATYFRLVMGFDAQKGQLSWVYTHPSEVIGGVAAQGALVVCDEAGEVVILDARSGVPTAKHSLGEPIKSCVAHADTFRAPAASAPAAPLAAQIHTAVTTRQATLATAQRLLLRELATLPDESATKTLVDLASDPRTAPVLAADAKRALASRRNGAPAMLAALARHYDFLNDVLIGPPVAPLADALAAMGESRAAPLLASHLLDPADSDEDVQHAAEALAKLATKAELPELRQFFSMYRASAGSDKIALAVASVGEAIARVDPKDGRALVEAAASDATTVEAAKERLTAVLAATKGASPDAGAPAPKASPKK